MNKVFKVVWSEARNAYVVVSELAKNSTKGCSAKKLLAMLIATGVMTSCVIGGNNNVLAATPSDYDREQDNKLYNSDNMTIGRGAAAGGNNSKNNLAIGNGAIAENYIATTDGSIAIGTNAHVENMSGLQEGYLNFGQGAFEIKSIFGIPYGVNVKDASKAMGSIAIGSNTYARSGSTMIGEHNYTGAMGDTNIEGDTRNYNINVDATTIGANSYNQGALTSVTGAYSIISGKYNGSSSLSYAVQNAGATIYGSLNSIESTTSNANGGVANSVIGFANKSNNSNATLIWGAGNEVTNSIESISSSMNSAIQNKASVDAAQEAAISALQTGRYAGGSVMVMGGGNKADYAKYSTLMGVQNKITGTSSNQSQYDLLLGYKNTITDSQNVTTIGVQNTISASGNKLVADNYTVSGANNIILGRSDSAKTIEVADTVIIGHNANASVEGGVALGSGSVANVGVEAKSGWDLSTNAESTDTTYIWRATKSAVSLGDNTEGKEITRRITNLAAGVEDTDAVNVAQLKKAVGGIEDTNTAINDITTISGSTDDEGIITITQTTRQDTMVDGVWTKGEEKKTDITGIASKTYVDSKVHEVEIAASAAKTEVKAGTNIASVAEKLGADGQTIYTINADGAKVSIAEGEKNISVTASDKDGKNVIDYKIALSRDLDVDSVKAGATTMNNEGLTVGDSIIGKDSVTTKTVKADTVTAGKTTIDDTGVSYDGKNYIGADGLNANDKVISNVKAGEKDTDAVNVSQLKALTQETNEQIINNANAINKLGTRVDKGLAGAAALAALHPMDFDPDDKLSFAAGVGNYRGENAGAIGMFYRPDEKVMFSVSGTVGNDNNMVNAGVSFALDRTAHVTNSKTAMAKEILDLRGEVAAIKAENAEMKQQMAQLLALMGAGQPVKAPAPLPANAMFPDVPENHWAYDYIAGLAKRGIIEGYPDGKFAGDRSMTRYEYAAMLYRALLAGEKLDAKLSTEFASELEQVAKDARFRVDRISGVDGDKRKVERVRVNGVEKDAEGKVVKTRDRYGNDITPVKK